MRIYLRPTVKTSLDLLQPALDLVSRHGPRLDTVEALQLLPPLVTTQDIRTFLVEALRAPIFDSHVVRQISQARSEQVARKLMLLQSNRVKVTDSRMYIDDFSYVKLPLADYVKLSDARSAINALAATA